MNDVAIAPDTPFLPSGLAKAHVDAAFDLSHDQHGIDPLAVGVLNTFRFLST